ncbi:MAG: SixA phosphatase family protein [Pyrinomonadaceae bacterium]
MKMLVSLLLYGFLFTFSASNLFAQYKKLTVILLRHAEKDVSEEADSMNPELSAAGKARAQKLIDAINKYEPDAIYSTQYIRTMETARPLARKRREMIQLYDERNLEEMKNLILSGKIKRLVVVGHNNTTPALVNALLGQDKYKKLGDGEYDKIWIVKIRRYKRKPAKVREKIIVY